MEHNTQARTERYISKLKERNKGIAKSGVSYNHNSISKKNDFVLILNPRKLYIPFVDQRWEHGGHVNRGGEGSLCKRCEVDSLKTTPAKVVGFDFGINYYDGGEGEVELKCADGKIRGLDKVWGEGKDFVFIPHPMLLESFLQILPVCSGFLYEKEKAGKIRETSEALKKYLSP